MHAMRCVEMNLYNRDKILYVQHGAGIGFGGVVLHRGDFLSTSPRNSLFNPSRSSSQFLMKY